MRIARAMLDYTGSDEAWAKDCSVWERMNKAQWPIESSYAADAIDIELAAWTDSAGDEQGHSGGRDVSQARTK